MIYSMELYQIRHFAAVAETGSFTKAAIRAAVSQPALSASIAKLEEEGLVDRVVDEDRRRFRLALSRPGQAKLQIGRERIAISERRLTQALSASEVATLLGLLVRVADSA